MTIKTKNNYQFVSLETKFQDFNALDPSKGIFLDVEHGTVIPRSFDSFKWPEESFQRVIRYLNQHPLFLGVEFNQVREEVLENLILRIRQYRGSLTIVKKVEEALFKALFRDHLRKSQFSYNEISQFLYSDFTLEELRLILKNHPPHWIASPNLLTKYRTLLDLTKKFNENPKFFQSLNYLELHSISKLFYKTIIGQEDDEKELKLLISLIKNSNASELNKLNLHTASIIDPNTPIAHKIELIFFIFNTPIREIEKLHFYSLKSAKLIAQKDPLMERKNPVLYLPSFLRIYKHIPNRMNICKALEKLINDHPDAIYFDPGNFVRILENIPSNNLLAYLENLSSSLEGIPSLNKHKILHFLIRTPPK